ncbi:DCC1-like thiol-disulfide oxidoreductase family protein [Ascidiimonas sp. W6]|uniref:DCC1-like thiol-disulfide oxidoreductase family protein n=1 Tax=Ascidiimonas meishanensis TaxID=3128903 RepID=UPI0030EC0E0A
MKTLEHHTLIYDDQCPLCAGYTHGFITTGMLDKNGRCPYQKMESLNLTALDEERAVNEIALIDSKNSKIYYGVSSLIIVISHSFPWIGKIARLPVIYTLLKKLYSFVSYNRKVVISNPPQYKIQRSCEPSFNYVYRLVYILFTILITAGILFSYNELLFEVSHTSNFYLELLIVLGQIPFQLVFLNSKKSKVIINYIGHLMTVSLFGSLLLLPMLIINLFISLPVHTLIIYFLMVATFMLFHHKKRVENLALPMRLTATWILYRILLLFLILAL